MIGQRIEVMCQPEQSLQQLVARLGAFSLQGRELDPPLPGPAIDGLLKVWTIAEYNREDIRLTELNSAITSAKEGGTTREITGALMVYARGRALVDEAETVYYRKQSLLEILTRIKGLL